MSDQRTRTRPANHDPRKRRIRSCTPDLRSRNRVRACHGLPFVGAARPHTPRLPPLPRRLTPEGKHPGTRTINDSQRTSGRLRGRTTGHGQRLTRRYSSQPGGSIFNAHLAQSSVSVSTRNAFNASSRDNGLCRQLAIIPSISSAPSPQSSQIRCATSVGVSAGRGK